jgi:hypothetical protein
MCWGTAEYHVWPPQACRSLSREAQDLPDLAGLLLVSPLAFLLRQEEGASQHLPHPRRISDTILRHFPPPWPRHPRHEGPRATLSGALGHVTRNWGASSVGWRTLSVLHAAFLRRDNQRRNGGHQGNGHAAGPLRHARGRPLGLRARDVPFVRLRAGLTRTAYGRPPNSPDKSLNLPATLSTVPNEIRIEAAWTSTRQVNGSLQNCHDRKW